MNLSVEDLFEYLNYDLILITSILNQDADATFAPSILLKILRFFPVGSVESRKYFSLTNWMKHRLRNSILTHLLRAFVVVARHDHSILILKTNIALNKL